jgi:hypothetical protein
VRDAKGDNAKGATCAANSLRVARVFWVSGGAASLDCADIPQQAFMLVSGAIPARFAQQV